VPCGLRAQAPAMGPAPAAPANSTLTPEFLEKMLKLIAAQGQDRDCPAAFANPLGLGATGQTWADHQAVAYGKTTGFLYGFAVSRGSDQDVLITVRRPKDILAFRSRRDGTLVSAFAFEIQSKQLGMRPPAKAQEDFIEVCEFWRANVDKLLAAPASK